MNKTPTPRTDAQEGFSADYAITFDGAPTGFVVASDFARQLERELNQAHEDGAELSKMLKEVLAALEAERSRARVLQAQLNEANSNKRWDEQSKL